MMWSVLIVAGSVTKDSHHYSIFIDPTSQFQENTEPQDDSNSEGEFRARGADAVERREAENERLLRLNVRTRVAANQRGVALGTDCSQCQHFHRALDEGDSHRGCKHNIQEVSKHRFHQLPPSTPQGFWDIRSPPTPKQSPKKCSRRSPRKNK